MRRATILLSLVALGLAGCGQKYEVRTGRATLERAMSRAFKRSYAASVRMRTGRPDRDAVRHASMRCRPLTRQPKRDGRPWPWRCRVRFYLHGSAEGHKATYGVKVGSRGCFYARSANFPARIPERVLGREGPDPLVYIRSCP
ncbi:MAG: hypothetical protein QOE65_2948 [Solirubrobacteraceae bacterium]|nr:hypothetical protein [Solirubrobacteraceae bacterium]